MDLQDFLTKLDGVQYLPSGTSARCPVPAHDDHVNSLSVALGENGNILVYCHAGCPVESIVESMGLTMADLAGVPHKVCDYVYTDLAGNSLYVVERWANPKTFRGYLPPPSERVLYNQVCIPWARDNGVTILIPEGEQDVDSCTARHIPAVTSGGGAGKGKWLPQYTEALVGCDVAVVADNDTVGREFAREKYRALKGTARSVQLLYPMVGKDITDGFSAGYDLRILTPLPECEDVGSYIASTVTTRNVTWAWDKYFPLGKLVLIEGDPGDGKSILTTDLAARFSTGVLMPDGSNGAGPWPVIMVSAEDDLDDTIVPRLEAAGADLNKLHLVSHGATPEVPFSFDEGLPAIYNLITRTGAKLVFFDPLMAMLGDQVDSHNDHSVRRALQPLRLLATRTGATVVVVRHLNKGGSGTKAIYRGGGSIAFTGAARATFLVTAKHDDPDTRVFACVKSNLARKPPSLTYTVDISPAGMPYVKWGDPVEVTAQQALDGPRADREDSPAADEYRSRKKQRIMAGEFLLDVVANGPKSWAEIVEIGKEEGFTAHTLVRARAEVGLTKVTGSGGQSTTTWNLPAVPFSHLTSSGGQSALPPNGGQMAKWEPETTEDEKLSDLVNRPLVCDVCAATVDITRWAEPYWVIRCELHNPEVYGGGK